MIEKGLGALATQLGPGHSHQLLLYKLVTALVCPAQGAVKAEVHVGPTCQPEVLWGYVFPKRASF